MSRSEAAAGRMPESDQLLASVAQYAPNHPAVLNELGVRMLDRGAPQQAQAMFARATSADPSHPALWANLANSLKLLGRQAEALDALDKALAIEPRHLSALLQKGALYEQRGDMRTAARIYQNMLACIPPGGDTPPAIKDSIAHARQLVDKDLEELTAALAGPLAELRERHGGRRQRRVELCLETLMGKRQPYYSQPTWMYMPELPAIEFFERADFPWLDAFEAETEAIRKELLQVLVADREGLQPYIDFPAHMPLDQFRELNRSRRWSAYFLWNQSLRSPWSHGALSAYGKAGGHRAALLHRGTRTHGVLFRPRRQHAHPSPRGRDQHPMHRSRAAGHTSGLRVPGWFDHA